MVFENSFFEDEVRDGFYVPGSVKRAWAAELEVLSEIDKICQKHNITYYADWGSLLASVRHKGFIPWDDDLDIVMKRRDYYEFLKYASDELPKGYETYNYRNSEDYWQYICRVVGKKRICFEQDHLDTFHQFPYICGIDIFVLDNVSDNEEEETARDNLARYAIVTADKIAEGQISGNEAVDALKVIDRAENTDFASEFKSIIESVSVPFSSDDNKEKRDSFRRSLYIFAEELFDRFNDRKTEYITQLFPFGLQNKDFRFPAKYYEKAIRIPYENITLPVPLYYDSVLKKRYGTYMKLVKNAGAHGYPFFESQHNEFIKLLDFELPYFKPDMELAGGKKNVSDTAKSYRETIGGLYDELKTLSDNLSSADDCIKLQETAISLGTLCEEYTHPALIGETETSSDKCSETVSILENICNKIFELHCVFTGENTETDGSNIISLIKDDVNALKEKLDKDVFAVKQVAFICFKSDSFSVYESAYRKLIADGYDVSVIPVPYFYKKYDGSIYDESYDLTGYPEDIKLTDYTRYDAALYRPEIIYIQNPYDEWNPVTVTDKSFFASRLALCTDKLVYIPWFDTDDFTENEERQYHNMKHYVLMPGVVYADEVIVKSENMRELYVKKLTEWAGEDTKSIWEKKIVADIAENISKGDNVNDSTSNKDQASKSDAVSSTNVKKILIFHMEISSFAQSDDIITNVSKKIETMENALFDGNLEVVWYQDTAFEENLRNLMPKKFKEYISLREQTTLMCLTDTDLKKQGSKEDNLADEADAYYGDSCRLAMLMNIKKKPVMIADYEV